jgi:hypothetical protein
MAEPVVDPGCRPRRSRAIYERRQEWREAPQVHVHALGDALEQVQRDGSDPIREVAVARVGQRKCEASMARSTSRRPRNSPIAAADGPSGYRACSHSSTSSTHTPSCLGT